MFSFKNLLLLPAAGIINSSAKLKFFIFFKKSFLIK